MYTKFEALLRERGVTPYQVSKATGIASTSLSSWKNGKYKLKVEKLMLLAKYFDVPLEYFLDEEGSDG